MLELVIGALVIAWICVWLYAIVQNPEIARDMQRHWHERQMKNRERRDKALGFAGRLFQGFLNRRR